MKVNLTPFSIYWFLFLILNVIYFYISIFYFFLLLPAVFRYDFNMGNMCI